MNRWLQIVTACFVIALNSWGQPTAAKNASFVFLIDTSAAMGRKQAASLRSVRAIIGSGFSGKIKEGDTFAIWTFDQSVHSDVFPAQRWVPRDNKLLAEIGAQLILSETHEGRSDPEAVFKQALDVLSKTNGATLVMITDQPLNGTPFDRELLHFYANRKTQILREQKAILTSLTFDGGAPVAFSTAMTGESLKMPDYVRPEDELQRAARTPAQNPIIPPPPEITVAEPLPPEEPRATLLARVVRPATTPPPVSQPVVVEKPAEAPVSKPSIPAESVPSVAKIDAPVASKPDSIPKTDIVSEPPAAKTQPRQAIPVEKESVQAQPSVPSKSEQIESVKATASSGKAPVPPSIFGFEFFAYVFAGVAAIGLIIWRIFTKPNHRETRSLITRSMDMR